MGVGMFAFLSLFIGLSGAQENKPPQTHVPACQQKQARCGSMLDLQKRLRDRQSGQTQKPTTPVSPTQPQPGSQSRG